MLSAKDIREFRSFLRQATDRQVQGIYDKEKRAGRDDYAELAIAEGDRRGIDLDQIGRSHSTKKKKKSRELSKEAVAALQARGRKAAADGLIGLELDAQLKAERLNGAEHHIVRAAFNSALENHSTKKSPAQLDREIAEALVPKSSVGGKKSAHATKRALPPLKRISTTAGDFDSYLAVHRNPMNDREFRLSWYALDGTGSIGERGLTQSGFRSEGAARAYAKQHYGGEPIRVPAWGVGPDLTKKIQSQFPDMTKKIR